MVSSYLVLLLPHQSIDPISSLGIQGHTHMIDSKWFLNVWITLSAGRVIWLPGGAIWYFNPLVSISLINSVEYLLLKRCRIGLIPAYFSVLYIVMNFLMRCSFFEYFIPVARIGPALLFSITITYQFLPADVTGKAPAWSKDIIPLRSLNFIAVIYTMWSLFSICYCDGYSSGGSVVSLYPCFLPLFPLILQLLLIENSVLLCAYVPSLFGSILVDVGKHCRPLVHGKKSTKYYWLLILMLLPHGGMLVVVKLISVGMYCWPCVVTLP